ncbi:hypothetical protein SAMN05428959_104625 [Duganella sp. CF517]|uniref:cupin domain-containing protein n=1 Tax=Duganella sp. CF517 TaxID=1881038 RepID=UPI0008B6972E|nr:cupin domain-containing protein [Duganella sp. CF517]SEO09493.1 hypothetical protein SAMN05428959_104625 [Duganella sp. CF517]
MEVVKFAEAPFYTAPHHEDVVARRLQGGVASSTDFALVGHSYLRDGAKVQMSAGTFGKVYVITEGSLIIEQEDGVEHVLELFDSIHIPAGEARAIRNDSGAGATMIVITPPVPA